MSICSVCPLERVSRKQAQTSGDWTGDAGRQSGLVIGAGEATGGAIARGFARDGYAACITRRHADKLSPLVREIEAAGRRVRAFGSDARKAEAVAALVEEIERNIGPIEVAIHNIGAKHALRALAQSMARELGPRAFMWRTS
jgi:short-subunit dehydrogenase